MVNSEKIEEKISDKKEKFDEKVEEKKTILMIKKKK